MAKLPQHIIGIDVETTSLDPKVGDIIDVAAITYDWKTGKEIDRFEALCKPKEKLSPEIIALTGITQDMVEDKLPFSEIREKLSGYIGTTPVFAHNASFDVSWFRQHGVLLQNTEIWDTFPLAGLAWPDNESYNLGLLAQQLGIKVDVEHRAAADVQMTWQLLHKHIQANLSVSKDVLPQIKQILTKAGLSYYLPLFKTRNTSKPEQTSVKAAISQPLSESSQHILSAEGPLAQKLPGFVPRPEQQQMADSIDQWFADKQIGLIEAATGTGKTYGYLIPTFKIAEDSPVIISTYTRHLQDQLMQQDVPKLLEALALERKVAVLKGRGQYICQRRLNQYLQRESVSPVEAMVLIKVLLWVSQHPGVDIERLNLSHQPSHILRSITADALSCRQQCTKPTECSYQAAKQRALSADIIIINHALLIQSIVGQESTIRTDYLVIDEAHHLPAVAQQAATIDFSLDRLGQLLAPFAQLSQSASDSVHEHIVKEGQLSISEYSHFLNTATLTIKEVSERGRLLLTPVWRKGSHWQRLREQGQAWVGRLQFLHGLTKQLESHVSDDEISTLQEARRGLHEWITQFSSYLEGNPDRIQWLELPFEPDAKDPSPVILCDTVLSVKALLEPLFTSDKSVVLTSATLTVGGSFTYLRQRLGLESQTVHEQQLPSSFDYEQNMLVYLLTDSPQPSSPTFDEYTADAIKEIAELLRGRTLGLFSSQKSVQTVFRSLLNRLNKDTFRLLAQNLTGGRHNILQRFRNTPESVLLGTLSFWEGVDVAGDSLSAVVIAKLPFAAPDDPIMTAVAEAEKINSFLDLSVPQAVLKLRQGLGRLLRTPTDRGVVVIVDSRFHNYDYGQQVIKSFPPATIKIGSRQELITTISDWFGDDLLTKWQQKK